MTAGSNEQTLPRNWVWVELNDICLIQGGYAFKSSDYIANGVPLLRISNITDQGVSFENKQSAFLDENQLDKHEDFIITKGDIVVALSGATIGKYGLFNLDTVALLNQRVGRIKYFDTESINPRYVFYYMNIIKKRILEEAYGAAQPNISPKVLAEFPLPLPPLNEQHRIVEAIETQFTRLDAAVAALKRAQANLKRYRASVLKAACEGRLVPTEAELAQAQGRSYEPAAALLERILTERRRKWEAENPKKKYQEPVEPYLEDELKLTEGWILASLEQTTNSSRVICYGILMPKEHISDGVLYVKVKDMKGDVIDLAGLNRTSLQIAKKYPRSSLKAGDILLSIRGTYGRVAEVPLELDGGNITQDTARLDISSLVSSRYVAWYLRSTHCQNYFKKVARGVAVKGVNIADVKPTPIRLPPLAEQQRIVAEVERRLSLINQLEKTIESDLARANRLRQSILKRAFAGKLVSQDPNDEPASVLLKRIQAAKNGQQVQADLPLT